MTERRSLGKKGSCKVQFCFVVGQQEGIARAGPEPERDQAQSPSQTRARPRPDEHVASVVEIYDALRLARFVFWVQCPPKSGAEARRGRAGQGKALSPRAGKRSLRLANIDVKANAST